MSNQWLILELNENIENITYREIESAILNIFGDAEYFIPIHHERMGSYISTSVLMEGYAFVRDCPEIRQCMLNLRDQRIFSGFLYYGGKFQTITVKEINDLKRKLKRSMCRKFNDGTQIRVLGGIFKNLRGVVISSEDGGKRVIIRIKRISREIIAPIPATLLEEVTEE